METKTESTTHIEVATRASTSEPESLWTLAKERLVASSKAIKNNKTLFLWSLFVQGFLVAYGFEAKLTGLIVAFPYFRQDYGYWYAPSESYVLSAMWQSLWAAGAQIGNMIGAVVAGFLLDRLGRKIPLFAALVLSLITTVLMVLSPTLPILFGAKIIYGVASGITLTVPPLYIAENSPSEIRGVLVSMINLFIVLGQFLAAAVANATQVMDGAWSYKLSFALTAVFPVVLLLFMWWMPESPAWLVAKNKDDRARTALRRLHGASKAHTFDDIVNTTRSNLRHETTEKPSFKDCFQKGPSLERTMIAVVILAMQPLSGMPFVLPYQTYFYELSGMERSFSIALGSTGAMLVASIIAAIFSELTGRRRLIIWLVGGIMIWDIVIGLTSLAPKSNRNAAEAVVGLVASWPMLYQLSLGSIGWAIASEIQTQRLRAKTMSIANTVAQFWFWVISFTVPYMLNPDEANLGGKIMLVYLGLIIGPYIYCCLRLPETRGRSFSELDLLYDKKINPRKFEDVTTEELGDARKTDETTSA